LTLVAPYTLSGKITEEKSTKLCWSYLSFTRTDKVNAILFGSKTLASPVLVINSYIILYNSSFPCHDWNIIKNRVHFCSERLLN
jgi:hypothetical protein